MNRNGWCSTAKPGSLCTSLGLIVVVIPVLTVVVDGMASPIWQLQSGWSIMSSSSAAQAPSHLDPFGPFALVPENYMIIWFTFGLLRENVPRKCQTPIENIDLSWPYPPKKGQDAFPCSFPCSCSFLCPWMAPRRTCPVMGSSVAISVWDQAISLYSPMKISLGGGQPLFNRPKVARLQKHLHFKKETMKYINMRVLYRPPNSPYIQEYFSTASALLQHCSKSPCMVSQWGWCTRVHRIDDPNIIWVYPDLSRLAPWLIHK